MKKTISFLLATLILCGSFVDVHAGTLAPSILSSPVAAPSTGPTTNPVSIAEGGTFATSQTTNGVNYFDGTRITSGTALTFTGTAFAMTVPQTITSTNAACLAVGANGATNPLLSLNCSTASVVTGLSLLGSSGASVTLQVTSNTTNTALLLLTKGNSPVRASNTSADVAMPPTDDTFKLRNLSATANNSSAFVYENQTGRTAMLAVRSLSASAASGDFFGYTYTAAAATRFIYAYQGHVNLGSVTVPTVSSCGDTPATATGSNDMGGVITEGTVATGCTITFSVAYTNIPACTVSSEVGLVFSYAVSTSAIVVTNVGALSSTKIHYTCKSND